MWFPSLSIVFILTVPKALRQFGQNFDLIARILPGRTYRMCKNKFKAEDKKNPALIDDALRNRISVGSYAQDVGMLHTLNMFF